MKRYLLFLALGVLLSSCDPGVSYERIIENNSSHDIWIITGNNDHPGFTQDSFSISTNSEMVISSYDFLGQTSDFEDCEMVDSSLVGGIVGNEALSISKDLNSASSWSFSVLKRTSMGGGDCECRLKLSDADID